MNQEADVLLVTATKVESRTAIDVFEQATGCEPEPQSIGDRTYFHLGTVGSARVFLTQSEMGSSGLNASQQAVSKGIEALSPVAVIMVGIAFGINEEKQAIGDILVTEQLRPYELQRMGTAQIILRGDKPHASSWLINHFRSADLQWEGARVRFGAVLTGEKLVDDMDFRSQLRDFEPEAIGGEMEGAGLYAACHDKKVDWILVKGICDWADGNKSQNKDTYQKTAARNAAKFVLRALQFASIDWQERRGKGTRGDRGSQSSGRMGDRASLERQLKNAKVVLASLEEEEASYPSMSVPPKLKIELADQREKIAGLEAKIAKLDARR